MKRVALRWGIKIPMSNIKIVKVDRLSWTVYADTWRFGKNAIMCQSFNPDDCIRYIREISGNASYTIEAEDINDPGLVWYGKHYADGHYYFNRGRKDADGNVKMTNKAFTRMWRDFVIEDIFNCIYETERYCFE